MMGVMISVDDCTAEEQNAGDDSADAGAGGAEGAVAEEVMQW